MTATMSKKTTSAPKDKRKPFRMVRMPIDLYDRMADLAKRTDRTVTREFIRAAEAHLRAHTQTDEEEK